MWRIALAVAEAQAEAFEDALGDGASATTRFENAPGGGWRVEALYGEAPDVAAIEVRLALAAAALGVDQPAFAVGRVPDEDWLARTREAFPPIRAGRYYIHGTHLPRLPGGAVDIAIDAGTAFGSGEHQTTRGCLIALDGLARRIVVRRALDMGCGSGILAIAAAKTWRAAVTAIDIDPRAVRVARGNAAMNGVGGLIRAAAGDGYGSAAVRRAGPWNLIVSNILAGPLVRMAPALARSLSPGGVAVLSGLLERQERAVLAAHRIQGLALRRRIALDGWHTLVLKLR
jgi:ribosomal protein L11 methyltransferase